MCNPLTSLGDAPSSSTKKGASSFVPGRAADGAPIMNSQRPATVDVITDSEKKQPLLVGVRGDWYDVTNFLPYHPGGDVILEFVGRDATAQFMAYHSPRVLANRKPVGTYDFDKAKPGGEVMQGDWMRLSDKYEQLGYYDTPLWFVWSRVAIIATFLSATLACVHVYTHGMLGEWVSRMVFVVGAICLAGFWQQSGNSPCVLLLLLFLHLGSSDTKPNWCALLSRISYARHDAQSLFPQSPLRSNARLVLR